MFDKLTLIQTPALVALLSLLAEGLLGFNTIGPLLQLIPLFASGSASYYAFASGYTGIAYLYAAAGFLALLSMTSVRMYANIPALALFLLIILLPHHVDGPEGDPIRFIDFPETWFEFGLISLCVTLFLVQRLKYPRLFFVSLGASSLAAGVFLFKSLHGLRSMVLQGFGGVAAAAITLYLGGRYFHYVVSRFRVSEDLIEDEQVRVEKAKKFESEIRSFILSLEQLRKQHDLRPRWLRSACLESGVVNDYDALAETGKVEREPDSESEARSSRVILRPDGIREARCWYARCHDATMLARCWYTLTFAIAESATTNEF